MGFVQREERKIDRGKERWCKREKEGTELGLMNRIQRGGL